MATAILAWKKYSSNNYLPWVVVVVVVVTVVVVVAAVVVVIVVVYEASFKVSEQEPFLLTCVAVLCITAAILPSSAINFILC